MELKYNLTIYNEISLVFYFNSLILLTMISVIVTEYKKRGYLVHALRSVFNQTLDREKYEVIVVKNEEDKEVDDYARKNGAKVIISNERWLGPKIAQGLEEAKGGIISLLEDDDLFTQDKLENVYNIFNEEKISEVRNRVYIIDSNNNILFSSKIDNNYKYFVNRYNYNHGKYFYMLGVNSCISIKRELIGDDVRYLKIAVDIYLTINAICKSENENVLFYGKPLTYFRIHSQNSTRPHTLEESMNLTGNYLKDYEKLYDKFYNCGKEVRNTLRLFLLYSKLDYYLTKLRIAEKDKELEKDFKFSFNDKIFFLDPFNKPRREFIIKGILASGFLFLPSTIRFHLFKFLQKHTNIVKDT